jgi:hypothetical protein
MYPVLLQSEEYKREQHNIMQTVTKERITGPTNHSGPQSRTIAIVAVVLFALSGLISGFSIGAFIHPKLTSTGTGTSATQPPIAQQTPVTGKTPHPQRPFVLGEPEIVHYTYTEVADSSTPYTFSGQVVNSSGRPVYKSDITCKIWLTQHGNTMSVINADNFKRLKAFATIQDPFPQEVVGGLNFSAATPQTQTCSASGNTSWNYTVSTSIDPGIYFIVLLTDWNGVHYNWYSAGINITR